MRTLIRTAILCSMLFLHGYLHAADDFLFRVYGSNTVGAALAPACAREYLASTGVSNPRIKRTEVENEYVVYGKKGQGLNAETVKINIAAHGSSTGFKALEEGRADIAMASRPIKRNEAAKLHFMGNMRSAEAEQTVAIDGLAILVHPDNPVGRLSIDQVAKLFSGQITNWQAVGGPDLPVTIYARDDRSGTWDTFRHLVLGDRYRLSATARRFESNDRLSDQVSQDRSAIGFSGLASVRDSRLLAISDNNTAALKPNAYTVATEDYPLSRRLFFYVPPVNQSPQAADFVAFCQSREGQKIVEEVGFVSQNIIAFRHQAPDKAPPSYKKLAEHGQRLSVNFRFAEGSPQLDNKAFRDLSRLVEYMNRPENHDAHLYLVGFSDAGTQAKQDLLLSRYRALAVRGALLRDNVRVTASIGLGSLMPVAANDKESKDKNGRVEVWRLNDATWIEDIVSR